MKYLQIIVYGQVQGVGFRYFTYTMASQLGVVGTVQNLGDGSVEIVAQAPDHVMEQFIAYVKQGPMYGRVDDLKVTQLEGSGNYKRFNFR